MKFHIVTLFPQAFDSYISESIIARAQKEKLISFAFYNPRDFVNPAKGQKKKAKPYLRIDDKPYGGGPGMVIQAEPVAKAIDKALRTIAQKNKKPLIIHLSPSGKKFETKAAASIVKKYSDVIVVCGRYEGIDARIKKMHKGVEYSIGDFVLTGGELPAMVIADCVSRQIEGVLGDFGSLEESRTSSADTYTRPANIIYKNRSYKAPKVLLSGHHEKIDSWKKAKNSRK